MSAATITLSKGGTVSLTAFMDTPTGRSEFVILDHPDAPEDMRKLEAGRVVDGGFQPAPFLAAAMRPETLRAIATLIEGGGS